MATLDLVDLVKAEMHLVKRGTGDAAEDATSGLFGIADARAVEEMLSRRVSIRPLALKRVL